jgi:hypothetical protein
VGIAVVVALTVLRAEPGATGESAAEGERDDAESGRYAEAA